MSRDQMRATHAITAKEGAAYLGVSVASWYRMEQRGSLPTYRLPSLNCRVARWSGERLAEYGTAADLRRRFKSA